jgi:ABC-type nitrate/sulfonate/bicarbonate transport system permease component
VLRVLWGLLHDPQFVSDLRVTVFECLLAFAIVTPLGLGIGFLLGESRTLDRTFGGTLELLMTVPKSVFLPVFVLMFGIGFSQKVIFAVVLTFFIVVPTGKAAVHTVPRGMVMAARAFGATRSQIYTRIYLPAVTPIVLSGVRLGLIFSVHGVVFAEMYGSTAGIGRNILIWGEQFQMDLLLAAVLLIVVLTVVVNEIMQLCETYSRSRLRIDAQS